MEKIVWYLLIGMVGNSLFNLVLGAVLGAGLSYLIYWLFCMFYLNQSLLIRIRRECYWEMPMGMPIDLAERKLNNIYKLTTDIDMELMRLGIKNNKKIEYLKKTINQYDYYFKKVRFIIRSFSTKECRKKSNGQPFSNEVTEYISMLEERLSINSYIEPKIKGPDEFLIFLDIELKKEEILIPNLNLKLK